MSLYDKAADNYAIALIAFRENKYNAAASRLYYAFYQACIKTHMENGRTAGDFMSSPERIERLESLRTKTDTQKWPHDVLIRHSSLMDLGLDNTQRQTILFAQQLRVIGDYGDNNKVTRENLEPIMEQAKSIFRQLHVPMTGGKNHGSL